MTYIPPSTARERMRASRPVCCRFTAPCVNTTLRPRQPTLLNKTMEGRENSWPQKGQSGFHHWCHLCWLEDSFVVKTWTLLTCPVGCMERTAEPEDRSPIASVLGYLPFSNMYMFCVNWVPSYAIQLKHIHTLLLWGLPVILDHLSWLEWQLWQITVVFPDY